ncbi:MAG: nickel-dependent lactate racemase [candidate division WOR-3 bacterium]
MEKREIITLNLRKGRVEVEIPRENFLYFVRPADLPKPEDEAQVLRVSLQQPVASLPLRDLLKPGMRVVIVGDDLTRPTPRERIFPVLLDELNRCGIPDRNITVLIGLGTHRYMTGEEIHRCFGHETVSRVTVLNHEWKDPANIARLGYTPGGTPIEINKIALEADFLMAVGSIVPHCYAGYGGGGKAIQPGISSWETTGRTHILPMERDLYLQIAGEVENVVRKEIEDVAEAAGLKFILNVILSGNGDIIGVVSGDPIKAHRRGVQIAQRIYERAIPSLADIVLVNAYPADIDYWQGIKPLSYAQKGLKKGGTSILVAPFPEGISSTHSLLETYAMFSYRELKRKVQQGFFEDLVCAATLLLHAKILEHSREVICVSEGIDPQKKAMLGFKHAASIQEALEIAFTTQGKNALVGIIDCGGDVLPKPAIL